LKDAGEFIIFEIIIQLTMRPAAITILIAFTGFIILSSCDKNDENNITLQVGYTLNFQNDKLISYSRYDMTANSLIAEATYDYEETKITETVYLNGRKYSKKVFIMGDEFAEESFDTIYNNDIISEYYYHKYFHLEGRLVRDEFENKFITADTLSVYNWLFVYSYSDEGNLTGLTKSPDPEGGFSCEDIFEYYDNPCKFDVLDFTSGITGGLSANLRKSKVYDSGCPGGPSYTYGKSNYSYEVNDDGYVVKMTDTYSGGSSAYQVVTKTTFEYNMD